MASAKQHGTLTSGVIGHAEKRSRRRADILPLRPEFTIPGPGVAVDTVAPLSTKQQHVFTVVDHSISAARLGSCVSNTCPLRVFPFPGVIEVVVTCLRLVGVASTPSAALLDLIGVGSAAAE